MKNWGARQNNLQVKNAVPLILPTHHLPISFFLSDSLDVYVSLGSSAHEAADAFSLQINRQHAYSLQRRSLKVMLINMADPVRVARISLVAVEGHFTACRFLLAQHLLWKPAQISETAASSICLEVTGSRTR
jgi:hypothetical protein